MKSPNLSELNDALLAPPEEKVETKRNSKDDLVAKIIKCCEDGDLELPYSDSKLKRMTKTQLLKLLAECIEEKLRNDMAEQVGAKKGSGDRVIALGALKMIHGIAANGTEKALNIFLPKRLRGGRVLQVVTRPGGGRGRDGVPGGDCRRFGRAAVHRVALRPPGHRVVGRPYYVDKKESE